MSLYDLREWWWEVERHVPIVYVGVLWAVAIIVLLIINKRGDHGEHDKH